jgi:type II secretory pathway pseudopilin PulG
VGLSLRFPGKGAVRRAKGLLSRPLNEPSRGGRRGESGFALIEVMIALGVLLIVLTGLGLELTTQYQTVGTSKNEQTGQALLARALNEVRAMPYTVVAKGLATSTTDPTVTTPTYISKAGTIWTFRDTTLAGHGTGEVIVHYAPKTSLPPPPFYQHKTVTTVNNVTYTALTFPTKFGSKVVTGVVKTWVSRVLRITVMVSWTAAGSTGQPTSLVGQTLVFNKTSACAQLGSVSRSGAAPCQPDFTAGAFAGNGVITIRAPDTVTTPIKGLAFTTFSLVLPGVSSTETLTQTSSVLGTAEASGVTLVPTSTKDKIARVVSKATNDPAAGTSDYTKATLSQTATTVTLGSTTSTADYWISASPSLLDLGTSVSTTSATATRRCANFTGVLREATPPLPCGNGQITEKGTAATLSAHLSTLGTATLARVVPTTSRADRVFTSREKKGTTGCTQTSGCIYADAEGGLGTVGLAGLPSGVTAPTGWATYLVKVTGFELQATASGWSKSGCNATTTKHCFLGGAASVVTAGTLSYYTGGTYKTMKIGATSGSVVKTVTVTSGAATVTITMTLAVGGAQCSAQTNGSTSGKPHIETCTASPLVGSIDYTVTDQGTVADFVMTVNLGPISASATYQRAT